MKIQITKEQLMIKVNDLADKLEADQKLDKFTRTNIVNKIRITILNQVNGDQWLAVRRSLNEIAEEIGENTILINFIHDYLHQLPERNGVPFRH